MKIVITGANGQLGKELAKQLRAKSDTELLLTDIEEMDITNINSVRTILTQFKPNVIINCAAYTAVDLCEDDQVSANMINTLGAINIAVVSYEIKAKIIHISTDYVFDGNSNKPYVEEDETNPQSVYGKSKLNGEKGVIKNNPHHFIIRPAWLYGEGKNFVNTMLALSDKHDTIRVVNDQIGSPTSTKELAKGILKLINTELYGIYHGTCEGYCTWYDFAKKIFEYSNIDIKVVACTSQEFVQKAKRPAYSVLENSRFKANLDYTFAHWDDALKEYITGEKA